MDTTQSDIQQSQSIDNDMQNTQSIFSQTFDNPIKPITLSHATQSDENIVLPINSKQEIQTTQECKQNALNTKQEIQANNTQMPPINTQIFHKTQTLLQHLASLSIFDNETLQKGMKIDLSHSNSDFFELYVGAQLHLACAYTYVLDERAFAKKDSPDLHFMRCEIIKKTPQELLKICVPTKNAFDYRVRSSGVDTRLFYEHPLRICPLCIAALCRLLSTKHKRTILPNQIKEEEIMGLIFKNKLKNLIM